MNEYMFFFVGGTCGSFVKLIFAYYLTPPLNRNRIRLHIDPVTGDCHNSYIIQTHWLEKIDITKKIILIDFDDDDKTTISRMAFWKVVTKQVADDPGVLKTQWDGNLAHIDPKDTNLLEQCFIKNPNYLIFPDWKDQIKNLNPALIITFKDILFGNLNKIIADFLCTSQLPEINKFINEYRVVNKKYIDF